MFFVSSFVKRRNTTVLLVFQINRPICGHVRHFGQTGADSAWDGGCHGSVIAALVTGVLTLAGVLVSNSRSSAVMEVKIDNLARQVERHNRMV